MAIYHFSAKVISRKKGQTSTACSAYRSGSRIEDKRTGKVFDYSRKKGVDHSLILIPKEAPQWMQNREELWNKVEEVERRKDSQLAREIEVSIPVELNDKEKLKLVRDFVTEQFVNKGMVADVAFHNLKTHNPHAHIMLTMREISKEGFGKKNREWNKRELIQQQREAWARHVNRALEKAGKEERVDHRSLEAQGINRIPQIHLGANVNAMRKRGISTERWEKYLSIEKANQEIESLELEIRETIRQISREKELEQKAEKQSKRKSEQARQEQERLERELSPQQPQERKRKAKTRKIEEKAEQEQEFSLLPKVSFNLPEVRQKPEVQLSSDVRNALLIGRTAAFIVREYGEWNKGQLVAEGQKYRIEMDVKNRDNQTLTVISRTTGKVILTSNGFEVKGKFNEQDVLHFQETRERLKKLKTSQSTRKPQRER